MILVDTSGLLAWIDGSQREHAEVVAAMETIEPPYLLSPFVAAELDYLLAQRVGQAAQHAFLEEVSQGSYRLVPFSGTDAGRALRVMAGFSDLGISLADASLVVLAERFGVFDLLTLDQRHFRVLPGPGGKPLRLLPFDA